MSEHAAVADGVGSALELPPLARFRHAIPDHGIADVAAAVRAELDRCFGKVALAEANVAVGLGSRGIANYALVAATVVEWLRQHGAHPFLVPAMGSHGGATAAGQAAVLAEWGISEAATGAPVRATMEVVELDAGELPVPLFMDRNAHGADHVLLINRVKPHTDFHGAVESGLIKMAVIGLGKRRGAEQIHRHGLHGLQSYLLPGFRQVLSTGKLLGGIGLVEDGHEQTAVVRAAPAAEIESAEQELLQTARGYLPKLPLTTIDVLIVDQMGKDISGTGMDTNVIGRIGITGAADAEAPLVRRLVVLGLTPASHGNALGVGLADITTGELVADIDHEVTNANVLTSTFVERGRLPLVAATAAEAVQWALRTCGPITPQTALVVRIRNTLTLTELRLSRAAAAAAANTGAELEQVSDWQPLCAGDGAIGAF